MNFKVALLLLSVVACISADVFYIARFYSDDKCTKANGDYAEIVDEAQTCTAPNTACTKVGNFYVKDACDEAPLLEVDDVYTGLIRYGDDKCMNSTALFAVGEYDKCYSTGTTAFKFSKCDSAGKTRFTSGKDCDNLLAFSDYDNNCKNIGFEFYTAFCATSGAQSLVAGALVLVSALLVLF